MGNNKSKNVINITKDEIITTKVENNLENKVQNNFENKVENKIENKVKNVENNLENKVENKIENNLEKVKIEVEKIKVIKVKSKPEIKFNINEIEGMNIHDVLQKIKIEKPNIVVKIEDVDENPYLINHSEIDHDVLIKVKNQIVIEKPILYNYS